MSAKKNSFNDLINTSEIPVLVDFYADWCGPCKMMNPVIKDFAGKMSGLVKVVKVDVDKNQAVASKLGIRSIPTLMLFHKGEVLERHTGGMSVGQLEGFVKPHLVKA